MSPKLRRFPNLAALTEAAADRIAGVARASVRARGRFLWVLSGGRTPLPLYERLASWSHFPWAETHVFWGDERCVPLDDSASNAGAAQRELLDHVSIPRGQIHLPPAAVTPPEVAAELWEANLRQFFGPETPSPAFDLVLLGLGADGHTASLFPGEPALEETSRWTSAVPGESASTPLPRITLTLPALRGAREVLFLATGEDKARLAGEIRAGGAEAMRYPAARVRPAGKVTWYVGGDG